MRKYSHDQPLSRMLHKLQCYHVFSNFPTNSMYFTFIDKSYGSRRVFNIEMNYSRNYCITFSPRIYKLLTNVEFFNKIQMIKESTFLLTYVQWCPLCDNRTRLINLCIIFSRLPFLRMFGWLSNDFSNKIWNITQWYAE